MTDERTVKQNNLVFKINEEKMTADIVSHTIPYLSDVYIPRSIIDRNQEYLITGILKNSLNSLDVKSLSFPPDSAIRKIENDSFSYSSIITFTLPPNIEELEDGWCYNLDADINVLPNSKNIKQIDKNFILRKSDPKSDNFDILIFLKSEYDEVIIPSFIRVIGSYSINHCIKKIEFTQNSELETIEKHAFSHSSIENIVLPSKLKKICESAFEFCEKLKSVDFQPNSELQIIEKNAFTNSGIESFTIPTGDVILEDGWCCYSPNLTDIKILPDNKNFLKYRNNLIIRKSDPKSDIFDVVVLASRNSQHIIIPPFVRKIAPYAFYACKFQGVIFKGDSQLQSIEKSAFSYSTVRKIKIPLHVTKICDNAFFKCKKLRSLEFAENSQLETIGKNAFFSTKIEKVAFPPHLTLIDDNAFYRCMKLISLNFCENSELRVFGNKCFFNCPIHDFKIPPHLTDIGNYAFTSWHIQNVEIPENSELKRIGANVFQYSQIKSITFTSDIEEINPSWCNEMQCLQTVKISPKCKLYKNYGDDFVLTKSDPKSDIFDVLFFANRLIEKAIIPSFIKVIGSFSFSHCYFLQSVEIPADSNLQIIGDYAFSYSKIERLKVLPQVTKIGLFSFLHCNCLQSVEIPANSELEEIGEGAFQCTSIEAIFIPRKVEEIRKNTFYCSRLRHVSFEKDSKLHTIEYYAFAVSQINNIIIPSNVKIIDNMAFHLCEELKCLDFDTSNTNFKKYKNDLIIAKSDIKSGIFDRILYANRNIQQVTIPSFIKVISGNAFSNCNYLKNVYFEKNSKLEKIEDYSFFKTAIKHISFPSNLKEICEFSFSCPKLKTVLFPPDSKIISFDEKFFEVNTVMSISIPISLSKCCRVFNRIHLIEIHINNNDKVDIFEDFYRVCSFSDIIYINYINAESRNYWKHYLP